MKITRRSLLNSASALVLLAGVPQRVSAEANRTSQAPDLPPTFGPQVTTFTLSNFSSSRSRGFARFGLPFKRGDVPAGSAISIARNGKAIACQFDERTSWKDGSLKFAVCHLRDADFSGGEARDYSVIRVASTEFSNSGSLTLADISRAHRFNIVFENVQKYDGSATSTYGSGSFTADFNTHASKATRITKVHSGAVCEGWLAWGMAADGGVADGHLKTNWYMDVWKNADGSIADIEFAAVVAQDWWSIAGKYLLKYTAILKDGAETIETYENVAHPYHAHWITCRLQNDDDEGRRHWRTSIPTLTYVPSKAYWELTGLVPPLNLDLQPTAIASLSGGSYARHYVPCSTQGQRADIDQAGSYQGRGLITNFDGIAFLRQTAADFRWARLSAMAGLHIPYHWRSNRNRVRRGEAADMANTIISSVMLPLSSSSYTFTADGMPMPVEAYAGKHTPPQFADGYVRPLGGTGVWRLATPGQASHAGNYSYFMYLHEGERHLLDATLDLAANLVQQQDGHSGAGRPFTAYSDPEWAEFAAVFHPPRIQWSGIGSMRASNNVRAVGWALNILGCASGICPNVDVQKRYLIALNEHQLAWVADGMKYMPESMKAAGWWLQYNTDDFGYHQYMHNFVCLGALFNYRLTENASALALGTMTANVSIGIVSGGIYRAASDQFFAMPKTAKWDPRTNDFFPRDKAVSNHFRVTISSATSQLTAYDVVGGLFGSPPALLSNSDVLYPANNSVTAPTIAIPSELTAGQRYYIINKSGNSFQISATPGGPPIIFAHDYMQSSKKAGGAYFGWLPSLADSYEIATPKVYLPGADSAMAMARAALVMANKNGVADATPALVAKAQRFLSSLKNEANWTSWDFA